MKAITKYQTIWTLPDDMVIFKAHLLNLFDQESGYAIYLTIKQRCNHCLSLCQHQAGCLVIVTGVC